MRTLACTLAVFLVVLACHVAQGEISMANGGFESPDIMKGAAQGTTPDNWFVFASVGTPSVGVTDSRRRDGSQSLKFQAPQSTNAFAGIAQSFDAIGENHYVFSIYVMSDPTDPLVGSSFGQVSIEWKNSSGAEISRTYGPTWNFELPSTRWERFLVEADAPADAVSGVAVVTFLTQDVNGRGTFFVDGCELAGQPKQP